MHPPLGETCPLSAICCSRKRKYEGNFFYYFIASLTMISLSLVAEYLYKSSTRSLHHLKKRKKKPLALYCARFALSLNKIGCTSAIKTKVLGLLFCIALGLHYLCALIKRR